EERVCRSSSRSWSRARRTRPRDDERQTLQEQRERAGPADGPQRPRGREEVQAAPREQERADVRDAVPVRRRELEPPPEHARALEEGRDEQRGQREPGLPAPEADGRTDEER